MVAESDASAQATASTATEHRKLNVLKPAVPETAEEFLMMLMRFANLLGALFGGGGMPNVPAYRSNHSGFT